MKNNWQTKKIGELCYVVGGGTPSKSRKDFYNGDIPWATVRDMRHDIIYDTEFKITEEAVKKSSTHIIPKGNVIIATRVGLGKICLIQNNIAINQDLKAIIPKHSNLSVQFLFLWFKSIALSIDSAGTGATVKGVKLAFINNLEIPLPPINEQQRIVKILDEVFEKIEKAKENAEKNLQNSHDLFEKYLQNVFAKSGEDWQDKTLEEISISFGRGKSKHRPRNDKKLYGGQYPFIQTGEIRNSDHFIRKYYQTYNEVGLAQSKLWPKGTICITIAANIAETGILDFDACFPDSIIGLVVNQKLADTNFVEYLLQFYKAILKAKGKGSAQDNINMATFENEKFSFPPLPEQQEIVRNLDALSAETKKLESIYQQKIADLEELKKSVLNKAFSGEL